MKKNHVLNLFSSLFLLASCTSLTTVSAQTVDYNSPTIDNGPIDTRYTGTITTLDNKPFLTLYSLNNNQLTLIRNRALAPNTSWYYDQVISRNGNIYYRVATNEWIRIDEIQNFNAQRNEEQTSRKTITIKIDDVYPAPIYDINMNDTGKTLAAGSSWTAFEDPVYIKDAIFYQVGDNEYVSWINVINPDTGKDYHW